MTACLPEELLIAIIARLLADCRHVAVGTASPIPGSAALLARERSGGATRVSILGNPRNTFWSDGSKELFDCAAQGRIDAFFLSGAQIDGQANVNLVGIGSYPRQKVRFSGSFGSAYLYHLVPRVILFRPDHSPRVLVPKVDFISAAGTSPPGTYRPGGPHALVTGKALFYFDRGRGRFRLESVHPGSSVAEIRQLTGFDFDCPAEVPVTAEPDAATLAVIRGPVARALADTYPRFAAATFGLSPAA
ncbi:MAG: CoA synthetase [Alphaproteobacteria bacterium]|nr:CoA synthetase [Alphaproteobacteria bacterium]